MSNQVIRQKRNGKQEVETPALSMTGRISIKEMGSSYKAESATIQQSKKSTEPEEYNDQAFELFMTKIHGYLPDSSHEVIQSAAEVASEQLSSVDVPVQQKRSDLEELLNVKISDTDLNELIQLANKILASRLEQEKLQEENEYVAVNFEESEDENDHGFEEEIDAEEESEPVDVICDWQWLEGRFPEQRLGIFDLLANKELTVGQLDNDLNELLDYEHNDLVVKCIENRWRIVFTKKMVSEPRDVVIQEMKDLKLDSLLDEFFKKRPIEEEEDSGTKRQRSSQRIPQRVNLEKIIFSTKAETTKITLPEGTFQENKKSYDIITVPPPEQPALADEEILPTSTLPPWAQQAFPTNETTTFNRIQSKIYPQAFETNNNLLICAPTGAGKTNVAMLTILRTIGNYRQNDHVQLKNFKIVYIAPLKALVQEQMREFQRRLTASYGVVVNELTGDLALSKQQILETQIIVTTPEKWDIITRKDPSYVKLVKLIIIDEIHLLHDERGPVLESIVSRTVRRSDEVRIVGLSATLPNYRDVAKFIQVPVEGLFYFDATFRPCPLQQEFVGVKEKKAIKKVAAMNEACYDRMYKSLKDGHQLIVFVHSRNETFTTAKYLLEKLDMDIVEHEGTKEVLKQEGESMKNAKLKEIISHGFGIHHAGLSKSDRSTVEDLFAQGHLRVLVSTATLAWGVNLPAHTVIIKGTETYSPETGTWVQLSPQDILQMLGRAGRPRYDKNGEGIIITSQDEIQYYLAILNQQLPIESQMVHKLVDNVNAEVVAGSITSIEEGIEWLGYTYFFVRMLQSPSLYGIEASYDLDSDPSLYNRRADLIYTAFSILHENKLIVYDPTTGEVKSTELGRISSYFYINFETINTFGKMLKPWHTESEVLRVFAHSGEFKYIPVRQEERLEISKLMEKCPIPIKEQPSEPLAKVNILLQTYISRLGLEGFALVSDMIYITQSAGRLLRALYEIALLQKWSALAKSILNMCKMVENRMWLNNSPLRQFGGVVPQQVIRATEMSHLPWPRYFQLTAEELGEALSLKGNAQLTKDYVDSFPKIDLQYVVQPINDKYMRVQVEALPEWKWVTGLSQERFLVVLEDCNGGKVLYHQEFTVKKRNIGQPHVVEMMVPIQSPLEPNYMLSFISEKWVNCTWKCPVLLSDVIIPKGGAHFMDSDVNLVLTDGMFPFEYFNKVQSAVFDAVYNTNENVFVGACKGDGKTVLAELAILKHWKENRGKVVFINPCQEILDKLYKKWKSNYDQPVCKLSGDHDTQLVNESQLILATPEQFGLVSKKWKSKKSFRSIDLIITDDVHLAGSDVAYEMLMTRIRMLTSQWEDFRIVSLSSPLAHCRDVCEWLGVPKSNMFNFPPYQEITLSIDCQDEKLYKELHGRLGSSTLVFVSSRSSAIDLARRLIEKSQDWRGVDMLKLEKYISKVQDPVLGELLSNGIGVYYPGMLRVDRLIVERLFETSGVRVLICSRDTCKYAPAGDNVVVYGTSVYEGYEHRYVDYPLNDLYEMIGCGKKGEAHIYTTGQMVDFYSLFLNLGLAVESLLPNSFHEFFMYGIVNGIAKEKQNFIDMLTYGLFYRRLLKNPSFYELKEVSSTGVSMYLSEVVESVVDDLIKEEFIDDDLSPLNKAVIASHYGSTYETLAGLGKLTNKSKLKDIFHAIASASEFEVLSMREGEDLVLNKLQNKLPIKYNGNDYESPHFKAFILLQAHISRVNLLNDLKQDQQMVVKKAINIANACVDTLLSNGYLNALLAMDLSQMIVQAVWSSDNPLKQVPHFTKDVLSRCVEHKVETVYDIMSLEDDERNEVLQMDDEELNDVALFVNLYPNVEIKYELEGDVIANEMKTVKIVIERDEELELLAVVCGELPIDKEENWWIVIGESQTRQLYGIKKVTIDKEVQSFDMDFSIPTEGKHNLTVYLVCDSYLDADKEMQLEVDVGSV